MAKLDLTQEQMVAVLFATYQELKVLLKHLEPLEVKDDEERRKAVIDNLKYLLQKGCKVGLRDKTQYTLFEGITTSGRENSIS